MSLRAVEIGINRSCPASSTQEIVDRIEASIPPAKPKVCCMGRRKASPSLTDGGKSRSRSVLTSGAARRVRFSGMVPRSISARSEGANPCERIGVRIAAISSRISGPKGAGGAGLAPRAERTAGGRVGAFGSVGSVGSGGGVARLGDSSERKREPP